MKKFPNPYFPVTIFYGWLSEVNHQLGDSQKNATNSPHITPASTLKEWRAIQSTLYQARVKVGATMMYWNSHENNERKTILYSFLGIKECFVPALHAFFCFKGLTRAVSSVPPSWSLHAYQFSSLNRMTHRNALPALSSALAPCLSLLIWLSRSQWCSKLRYYCVTPLTHVNSGTIVLLPSPMSLCSSLPARRTGFLKVARQFAHMTNHLKLQWP